MGVTGTAENSAYITGTVASPYYLSRASEDGPCHKAFVAVRRLSGAEDVIPVIVPETCLSDTLDATGRQVTAKGTFQSKSRYADGKRHLDVFMYADAFFFTDNSSCTVSCGSDGEGHDETEEDAGSSRDAADTDINHLALEGFIVKEPMFRTTPRGKKIADLLVAVNSPDPKCIPCIAWGKSAYLADTMEPGYHIRLEGRIQSREYEKALYGEDGEMTVQKRVAYEVSCSSIEILKTAEEIRERNQREERREEKRECDASRWARSRKHGRQNRTAAARKGEVVGK